MARSIIRTEVIDPELMLRIKREFPKLNDFYRMGGLSGRVDEQVFYSVMRGEKAVPETVTQIELAYNTATDVRNMNIPDVVEQFREQLDADVALEAGISWDIRIMLGKLLARGR